jgi:SAM-dependent methyltransferase
MQNEFKRLQSLGWELPRLNSNGLFSPLLVDETKISFPSEVYDSPEVNDGANGFWAAERGNLIASMLRSISVKTLWEIGAGNGNAAIPLRDLGINVIPIEPLQSGAITLVKNGFPTFHSTLEDLKLPNNSIGAIGAFDVLEHLENPQILLSEIHRILQPGGFFVCSVPAYNWLFSDFDVSIGHFKRYSKTELKNTLESAGLEITKFEWLFGFLVVPALLLRRIPFLLGRRRSFGQLNRTNNPNNYFYNSIVQLLSLIVRIEKALKIRMGLSILCISLKPKDENS